MSNKQNKDENTIQAVAWGVGAALGTIVRFALHLGSLWLGLWVLNNFGWLPF